MLFKLLFVISIILSAFSEKEMALSADHKLSLTDVSFVTFNDALNAELDFDPPFTFNSFLLQHEIKSYGELVVSYTAPQLTPIYFSDAHPRAPPACYS